MRTWRDSRIASRPARRSTAIHSVASFFVSRVDTEVDKRLDAAAKSVADQRARSRRSRESGDRQRQARVPVCFRRRSRSPRWKALAAQGATVQRPLWASTSTKNPAYRDVMYVEELIGPDTVNTMPPADDRGVSRSRNREAHGRRRTSTKRERAIEALEKNGISMRDVTDKLLVDGIGELPEVVRYVDRGLQKKTKALGKELAESR